MYIKLLRLVLQYYLTKIEEGKNKFDISCYSVKFHRSCRCCRRYFSRHFNRRLRRQPIGFNDSLRGLLWLWFATLLRLTDIGRSGRFIGLSKMNYVPAKNTLWKLDFVGSFSQAILVNSFLSFLLSSLPWLNSSAPASPFSKGSWSRAPLL